MADRLIWAPWYALQRRIDLWILWPQFKKHALDLDHARAGFALHAMNDRAWLVLGGDELLRRIDRLD